MAAHFANISTDHLDPRLASLFKKRIESTNSVAMNKAFTSVGDQVERRSLPGESEFNVASERTTSAVGNSRPFTFADDDEDEDDDDDDLRTMTEVRETPRTRFLPNEETESNASDDRESFALKKNGRPTESVTESRRSGKSNRSSAVIKDEVGGGAPKMSEEAEMDLKIDLALYLSRVTSKMDIDDRLPRPAVLARYELSELKYLKRVYKRQYDEKMQLNMLRNLYVATGLAVAYPATFIMNKHMEFDKANFYDYMYEMHAFYAGSIAGNTRQSMPMDAVLLEIMTDNELVQKLCGKYSQAIYGHIMFTAIYAATLREKQEEEQRVSSSNHDDAVRSNKESLNEAMAKNANNLFAKSGGDLPIMDPDNPFAQFMSSATKAQPNVQLSETIVEDTFSEHAKSENSFDGGIHDTEEPVTELVPEVETNQPLFTRSDAPSPESVREEPKVMADVVEDEEDKNNEEKENQKDEQDELNVAPKLLYEPISEIELLTPSSAFHGAEKENAEEAIVQEDEAVEPTILNSEEITNLIEDITLPVITSPGAEELDEATSVSTEARVEKKRAVGRPKKQKPGVWVVSNELGAVSAI